MFLHLFFGWVKLLNDGFKFKTFMNMSLYINIDVDYSVIKICNANHKLIT